MAHLKPPPSGLTELPTRQVVIDKGREVAAGIEQLVESAAAYGFDFRTSADTIVAELRPPPIDIGKLSQDEILREWQRRGVMTPAVNSEGAPPKGVPVMSFEELMKGLAEDREDR